MSVRPTPFYTDPMGSGPENTSSPQNRNQKIHDFQRKKGGFIFSTFLTPPPSLKKAKKWVSSGGHRGGGTKNSQGDAFIGQNNDFYKVSNEQFSPLRQGRCMGPKRGGMWRFPLYAGLPGFDLTTSAM